MVSCSVGIGPSLPRDAEAKRRADEVVGNRSLGGGVAALLSIMWSMPTETFRQEASARDQLGGKSIASPQTSVRFVTSFESGLPAGRPVHCYTVSRSITSVGSSMAENAEMLKYGIPCVASLDLVKYSEGLITVSLI
jgi:hypothetical protein